MPEIITEHGNYKNLIDDILESLKIAPGKRWDYVLFSQMTLISRFLKARTMTIILKPLRSMNS